MPLFQVLVIQQFNTNTKDKKYFSYKACKNGFSICYTHSVNKGRVKDFYKTSPNGELVLYQSNFVNYGAGISEPEEIANAEFKILEDGTFSLVGINRKLKSFLMAVGVVANHSIIIEEKEYFLNEYFKSQTRLKIFIKKVSLFEYLFLSSRF